MKKYYGKENKGFLKGRKTRIENAISKRRESGQTPFNNKEMAQMMDNLYGTNYMRHHVK